MQNVLFSGGFKVKYKNYLFIAFIVLFFIILFNPIINGADEPSQLQEKLYKWFEIANPFYMEKYNIVLYSEKIMHDYYNENNFKPVWVTDTGVKKIARDFIDILQDSRKEGFFPGEYNLDVIKHLILHEEKLEDLTFIDLLLTNTFFIYTSDKISGRLSLDKQERVWVKENDKIDLKNLLSKVIKKNDIYQINNIVPRLPEYKYLKEMLGQYRKISEDGGWPSLEKDVILEPGDSGKQVEILYKRLKKEPGQLVELKEQDQQDFDRKLQRAVFNFQQRYGLVLTGKVDEDTRKTLNLSSSDIVDKIVINLERLRYLNQNPQGPYIIVNIPEFKLSFIENGERIWGERVVVGTRERKTPTFSTEITGLHFNPRWYIPHSIAVKDFLPRQKEDSSYFDEKHIRVYKKNNSRFYEVAPESLDWQELNKENFDYYLWQDSGPWNALGNVIFRSPNDQHIYIHDTPDKYLFNYRVRTNSSGCVRVQNALKMAEYIVENFMNISKEDMDKILESKEEVQISLEKKIPLHFMYLTVWANKDKELRILRDIYDKDEKIKKHYFGS